MKVLSTPVSEKDIRSLTAGDTVFITGNVITGRDEVHIRALEYLDKGKSVPSDLKGAVLYHCGPIMQKGGNNWSVVAAGPTTSARMNSLEARFIREFGIKAIIGKGGMSEETVEAMKECGCVYLAAVGGTAVSLAECLKYGSVHWDDLGMAEAMWTMKANKLGPLIVAIDAKGNDLYKKTKESLIRDV